MTNINPFIICPIYETKHFTLRKLEENDCEKLFPCYSDVKAAKFFNGDNCGISFFYDDLKEFKLCVDYWLKAQNIHDFIRFTIIDKAEEELIGTVEICPSNKYSYEGKKVGVLRLDIKSEYETKVYIDELFETLINNLYKDFTVDFLITKAIPEANVRLSTLKENNFAQIINGEVVPFEDYYVKGQLASRHLTSDKNIN